MKRKNILLLLVLEVLDKKQLIWRKMKNSNYKGIYKFQLFIQYSIFIFIFIKILLDVYFEKADLFGNAYLSLIILFTFILGFYRRLKMYPVYFIIINFLWISISFFLLGIYLRIPIFRDISLIFISPLIIHLLLVFPEKKKLYDKSGYILLKLLYILFLILAVVELILFIFNIEILLSRFSLMKIINLLLLSISFVIFITLQVRNYFTTKNLISKRKHQYIYIGLFSSLLLSLIYFTPWWKDVFWLVPFPFVLFSAKVFRHRKISEPARTIIIKILSLISSLIFTVVFVLLPLLFVKKHEILFVLHGVLFSFIYLYIYRYIEAFFDNLFYSRRRNRLKMLNNMISLSVDILNYRTLSDKFAETVKNFTDSNFTVFLNLQKNNIFEVNSFSGEYKNNLHLSFDKNKKDGIINYIESFNQPVVLREETVNIGYKALSVEDKVFLSKINAGWIFPLYLNKDIFGIIIGSEGRKPFDSWMKMKLKNFFDKLVPVLYVLKEEENKRSLLLEQQRNEDKRRIIDKIENKICTDSKRSAFIKFSGNIPGNYLYLSDNSNYFGYIKWEEDQDDWLKIPYIEKVDFNSFFSESIDIEQDIENTTGLKITDLLLILFQKKKVMTYLFGETTSILIYQDHYEKIEAGLLKPKRKNLKGFVLTGKNTGEIEDIRFNKIGDEELSELFLSAYKDFSDISEISHYIEKNIIKYTENVTLKNDIKLLKYKF